MATFQESSIQQGTAEYRKWQVDFTDDLPSGIAVTGGTAVHIPPSGNAVTPTISVSNPYVTAGLTGLTVTGIHYLDVIGTFSNSETSLVRIAISVGYKPT